MKSRTNNIIYNSITSLALQVVNVICGFVLPRSILQAFGSEVNGAIASITQFLGYISLLEAGVGGVTRAALYKPLASMDIDRISGIAKATQNFFHKLSYIFIGYVLVLAFSFKYISSTTLDATFLFSLVIIIASSIFAQYYFGLTYSIILQANQQMYISNGIQVGTVILNTFLSVTFIKAGCGIRTVKFVSALVYIIRPILLNYFAKKQFKINKNAVADNMAIKDRWNGLGQHIAFYVHNNVDIMVITVMLGLKWTSIYSVYYMIVSGIKNVINSLSGGSEAAFGNMIAKKENDILQKRFQLVETLSSIVVTILFSTTGILLLDFVSLYTQGITDINYLIPSVGILFVISESLGCIKQQYQTLILAAGHYRETQVGAFIEAGLNVILSVLFAIPWGLSGILIATIIATFYRLIAYVLHLENNILVRSRYTFVKRQCVNILNVILIVAVCKIIPFFCIMTYTQWCIKAVVVLTVAITITLILNMLFYRENTNELIYRIRNIVKR